MTAKQRALDVITSMPDDSDPQDIVRLLIHIYRIKQGLAARREADPLLSKTEQINAWRQLAGQWQSDHPVEEIEAIYAARTLGREVDL